MALEKSVPTTYGVDVVYWRIARVIYTVDGGSTEILMYGYPTEEVRRSGAQPLYTQSYTVTTEQDPTRETLYVGLKAVPAFADAVDVIDTPKADA